MSTTPSEWIFKGSAYKGVHYDASRPRGKRWTAHFILTKNKKSVTYKIGTFGNVHDAARKYDSAVLYFNGKNQIDSKLLNFDDSQAAKDESDALGMQRLRKSR